MKRILTFILFIATTTLYAQEFVDLGLSVKWATCNLGGFEDGQRVFYEYGDTISIQNRNKQGKREDFKFSKVVLDEYNELSPQNDRATYLLGKDYHIPTYSEVKELIEYCTCERIEQDGEILFKVTGPNGNSIFFNKNAEYMTSTVIDNCGRHYSFKISPQISKEKNDTTFGLYVYNTDGCITEQLRPVLGQKTSTNMEFVDLGLSVLWANKNMKARNLWDIGSEQYSWSLPHERKKICGLVDAYTFLGPDCYSNNARLYYDGTVDLCMNVMPKYDAATTALGDEYRTPSKNEYEELLSQCEWKDTVLHGQHGFWITGKTGNSIFFPAAEYGVYYLSATAKAGKKNTYRFDPSQKIIVAYGSSNYLRAVKGKATCPSPSYDTLSQPVYIRGNIVDEYGVRLDGVCIVSQKTGEVYHTNKGHFQIPLYYQSDTLFIKKEEFKEKVITISEEDAKGRRTIELEEIWRKIRRTW